MKAAVSLGLLSAVLLLAACGEKQQTASIKKSDVPAWQGASNAYVEGGWKPGDQASWEQQMRNRAQSQNEYARAGTP